MKKLIDVTWIFTIEQDAHYGLYWYWDEDIKIAGVGGFICSNRHYKTASGCLKNLQRFVGLNKIKNYRIKGITK